MIDSACRMMSLPDAVASVVTVLMLMIIGNSTPG
jgi:hypothetical protein